MAGGFRGPLLPLALSAAVATGGFQNPLPVPPVSGGVAEQAGFRSPLPVPPVSAGEGVEPEPEPEVRQAGNSQDFRRRQDDELILTFVMAVISEVN